MRGQKGPDPRAQGFRACVAALPGRACTPALLLAALFAPLVLLSGCKAGTLTEIPAVQRIEQATGLQPSDEEQIAAVLEDVCLGMQERQIYKVLAYVSNGYRDADGRDYEAVQAYLNEIFKKYRAIRITRVPPRISIDADRARAVETFGTVAEPQDPAREPPINVQGQVSVDLVKVQGRWRIVEWGRLL